MVPYDLYAAALCLDGPTLANLELLEGSGGDAEGSLLAALDTCASPGELSVTPVCTIAHFMQSWSAVLACCLCLQSLFAISACCLCLLSLLAASAYSFCLQSFFGSLCLESLPAELAIPMRQFLWGASAVRPLCLSVSAATTLTQSDRTVPMLPVLHVKVRKHAGIFYAVLASTSRLPPETAHLQGDVTDMSFNACCLMYGRLTVCMCVPCRWQQAATAVVVQALA